MSYAELLKLAAQGLDLAPERFEIEGTGDINDGQVLGPLAGGVREGFVNVHSHPNLNLNLNLNPNLNLLPGPDTQPRPRATDPASCFESVLPAATQCL